LLVLEVFSEFFGSKNHKLEDFDGVFSEEKVVNLKEAHQDIVRVKFKDFG
jgi:hypothetical protein